MSDESKSMVKKIEFSALAMIFVMGVARALLPLADVGVGIIEHINFYPVS